MESSKIMMRKRCLLLMLAVSLCSVRYGPTGATWA